MSILVSGSLAIDYIMVFRDRFKNHILPDRLHVLNVAFHVPTLRRSFGGTAGNIAYNLRLLGDDPLLLASVGSDFGPYAEWLDRHGIDRRFVRTYDEMLTAQAFITTDLDDNQITAFHSGAMERASDLALSDVTDAVTLGIVSPNAKQAMLDVARDLKRRGISTVVDPGQQLSSFTSDELLALMEGAAVYVVNDYEWSLTQSRIGQSEDALVRRAGTVIVTLGEKGSRILRDGERVEIPPVRAERVVDPTGCGDAYRAGLLHGMQRGLPLEAAARIGSLLGALEVEHQGTQGLALDREAFRARYQREFGARI
ncbi:MAG: carbohydrate kinase family protein [Deltaproteobacteria bacterium]|nr:carbohydrate kinase family protein [Deltaproteobacteria bacterium]